ncbi:MAG TPA: acyl-CoA synthetase [Blastococcus sp.]|nr:acyl-CoA synthetase [Blastococcus sp.]
MHLSEIARRTPDKPAVVMSDGSRGMTFAELDRRSLQVEALLHQHGIGAKDHVALVMDNGPEFLEVAWGAQRAGTLWTPVNWHLTEDEAAYVVSDCGARVLFATEATGDLAARIVGRSPGVEAAYVAGESREGLVDYVAARDAVPPAQSADEVEGTYFFYSSGTTGTPKGIRPNHAFPPFGTGLAIEHVMASSFGFGADSVYLCPAPLYHAAPIGWSMGAQRNGGSVVLMEKFDPLECLRAIEQHGVTHVQFVPTHFVRMLKLPEEQRRAFDLSSLQVVIHAAAPCPVDVKRQMIDWLGPKIMEFYAGSEGSGMTVISAPEWLAHPGSVGRAALGTLHIVGEDGEELPPGEVGTVYFEGGGTFEYYNDPEKTAKAFNDKGWATLGDLGSLDEEGYLYLADRRTDLIISGGVNVYPAEVEEALVLHPAVADVAVIGVPDDEMGQAVRAVVQPAADRVPGPELAEELLTHCRTALAGFKRPRSVVFVDELPRLPTGKLLRRRVREEHGGA